MTVFGWAILLCGLVIQPLAAAPVVTLRYEEIPTWINRDNTALKAEATRVEAKEALQGHLGRSFLPEFTARAGRERFKAGRSSWASQPYWSLGVSLNLFRGGRDQLEEQMRGKDVERWRSKRDLSYWREVTLAREAYYELVLLENLRLFNDEEVKLTQKNEEAALRRIRAGVASRTDQVEFEMQAVALKQDRARIDSEIQRVRADLRTRLGIPTGTEIQITPDTSHIHEWEKLLPINSLETQPDLREIRASEEQQILEATQARRAILPRLDILGGYERLTQRQEAGDSLDRKQVFIGAELSWSLGESIEGRVLSSSLKLERDATALDLNYQTHARSEQLSALRDRIGLLHDQIHDAQKNIERVETYMNLTMGEYTRGVKNSPDVLGATQRFIEFKRRHAELVRDFQVSKARYIGIMAKDPVL